MHTRPYHDQKVTLASLGGEGIIKSPDEDEWDEAREIIETYLDAGGVLIDTAMAYTLGDEERLSEKRFGEILPDRDRDSFIICTKTESRDRDGALRDLDGSLEALGLDYVDEWRLHHLDEIEELDEIFAKDGAIHAMDEAVKDGRVKRASISGHSDPDVLLDALSRYEFKSVLGALNAADNFAHPFQKKLIPYCKKHGVTFIAMKLCARGKIFRKDGLYDFQDAFNYALSVPGVNTAIVGINNIEQLNRLIEADENFKQLSKEEMKELEAKVEPYAKEALFFRKGIEWGEHEYPDLPNQVL